MLGGLSESGFTGFKDLQDGGCWGFCLNQDSGGWVGNRGGSGVGPVSLTALGGDLRLVGGLLSSEVVGCGVSDAVVS